MRDLHASSAKIESSPTTIPAVKVASNFPKQSKIAPDTNAIISIPDASRQIKSAPVASSSQEVLPRPTISASTTGSIFSGVDTFFEDHFPLDGDQTSSASHAQGFMSKPSLVPAVETDGSLPSLPSMHPVIGEEQLCFSTRFNLHTITKGSTIRSALEEGDTIPVEEAKAAKNELSMINEQKDVVLTGQLEMLSAEVAVEPQEEISEQTNEFTSETSFQKMVAASWSSVPREIPKLVPVSVDQSTSLETAADSIEIIATALPTELSPEQRVALEGFKAFVSTFRGRPPASFVGAKAPLFSILTYVSQSGYPVRHLDTQLQEMFALCASYADISAKSLSEIGEESCAELLNEVEDHLAAARNQKAQTEATQFEALTTLDSLRTEYTTVIKEVEDLQSRLAAMNKRKEALVSQIGPLERATMDREQVLEDLSNNVTQAEENSHRIAQELAYLKEDSSFWEAKRTGLLSDIEMRINNSLDNLLSSFS